jgi:hypothetical protein
MLADIKANLQKPTTTWPELGNLEYIHGSLVEIVAFFNGLDEDTAAAFVADSTCTIEPAMP